MYFLFINIVYNYTIYNLFFKIKRKNFVIMYLFMINKIIKFFIKKLIIKSILEKNILIKRKFLLHFLTASIKYNHFTKLVFGNLMSKKIQNKYV
jgi:hypothetical protein